MSDSELIELGHIQGAYGLKGWVKVYSETRPRENIFRYSPWFIETKTGWKELKVLEGKPHGKTLVAQLADCFDRNGADELIGCKIAISSEQLESVGDDEYYWNDLIGCSVVNLSDQCLGEIAGLYETGGHDVLSVMDGDLEILIPFVPGIYVKNVELDEKLVLVDWEREFSE